MKFGYEVRAKTEVTDGVKVPIYHTYYYLVMRCKIFVSISTWLLIFKSCKNSHVRQTRLKYSVLT